jgi:alpha 1,2-mannosyltransferase
MCGHALLQWGLTPTSARYDSSFRPPPAFLHTILTKHRHGLQPAKLFSHYKRPREDGINDPRLIRTLYEYTGDCFDITLKGPDGLPDSPNSYFDGQGELVEPMSELLPPHVWKALFDMSVDIAGLNVPGE